MVYIIVTIILAVILGIFFIDKKYENSLINKVAKIENETKIWNNQKVKENLKNENVFISKFSNIQFEEDGILFEKLKKHQKVDKKLFLNYDKIKKVEKFFDGNKYILNNGLETYDNYYLDIYYLDENIQNKERICIEKSKNENVNPIDKIKYNTYLNVLEEKINEVSDNQLLV